MRNPFAYGGVVSGDAFCNRKKELAELLRAVENGGKLFIYSERRMGKTSLVQLALAKLPTGEYLRAYVDLWPTDNEASFATTIAKALAESMSSTADSLLETARTFFGMLAPSVTIDSEGKPKVTFGIGKAAAPSREIDDVLEAPARMAARGRRKVVVVFDEFQQILEYGGDLLERRLRSSIQQQPDVSYLFLGSRKHLIQKMFLDKSRPLYRAGGHYPLGSIARSDWLPFIRRRFFDAGKRITDEQIGTIYDLTEGHPFYTQHLCHVLWERCEADTRVTDEAIASAVQVLLERESYTYTTLWESLTLNQRRFLKGLAAEPAGVRPFAGDFIGRYGLSSASNAQRAVAALLQKDVIDRDNGSHIITDRFFKVWIQKLQAS